MSAFLSRGLGWHPDLSDVRDYTPDHAEVANMLGELERSPPPPSQVDWREFFPEIQDQGNLNSSCAHACVALLQYSERRAFGRAIEPSRLFVYQASRRLLNWTGDSGATLRATCKAIARFGVPSERHWPYDPARLGQEPDAFVYAAAQDLQPLYYVRIDGRGKSPKATLQAVKSLLAAGFPLAFGFPVCSSLSCEAEILCPTVFDALRGGQAVVGAGYDDDRRLASGRGAVLVRSSWGATWGDGGYGWLPYGYVTQHLTADFWTFLRPAWLASGEFRGPQQ